MTDREGEKKSNAFWEKKKIVKYISYTYGNIWKDNQHTQKYW